jgi:glycosyltransferase involved in cell wall biosynthesis
VVALRVTLEHVLEDPSSNGVVDVFAARDEALAARFGDRLRWYESQQDLGAALGLLQPDGSTDIAWVRAGLLPSRDWAAVLQSLLQHDEHMGAASPLDLDGPWCSPLEDRLQRSWRTAGPPTAVMQALTRWLTDHASGDAVQLGVTHKGCGVLKARAAVLIAAKSPAQDPAASWNSLMARAGLFFAFSRHALVVDTTDRASGHTQTESTLLAETELWRHAHPLNPLRSALAQQWPSLAKTLPQAVGSPFTAAQPISETSVNEMAPDDARPEVRLHVAHSWGGGLSKWVRDFVQTDRASGRGHSLVLRSVGVFGAFGQRLALYANDEEVSPLRFWELGTPIHATATAHLQVREILREIIEEFRIDHVIVSSLIGHSLDVLRTGLPTLVVAHDHYPFCVTLYAEFEGECRQCDRARLSECIQRNPAHRFFGGVQAQDWLALREAFIDAVLTHNAPIVAPSPSVAARWQSMMPALRPPQFRVIGHGVSLPETPSFTPPPEGPLRVVVLGRLSPEKGASLLAEMLGPLRTFAELILVGCGDRIDPAFLAASVQTIPNFDNADLPTILSQARPHVGLLMSTVPETFSFALSELWHAGIPVVATRSGALADRIEHGITGFIAPARADALLAQLSELNTKREALAAMRTRLLNLPSRGLEEMVRDYLDLLPAAVVRTGPNAAAGPADINSLLSAGSHRTPEESLLARTLMVNPEATWMQALRAFWRFTCLKASRSPRLPPLVKRVMARLS